MSHLPKRITNPSEARQIAELVELLDDVASLFQNAMYYGLTATGGQGAAFRDQVIKRLNKLSPKPNTGRERAGRGTGCGDLKAPAAIVRKAHTICRKHMSIPWPSDGWFTISPEWDLNLWIRGDRQLAATLYAVVDGQTQTDRWHTVYPKP